MLLFFFPFLLISISPAKDLTELGIDIELFSMNKVGEKFDFQKFYKVGKNRYMSIIIYPHKLQNIILIPDDEDTGQYNFDAAAKFEELKARVRRKEYKKRNIARIPFYIGSDDVAISVKMYDIYCSNIALFISNTLVFRYTLVQETKKGTHVWLDSKTNQLVKTTTKYVCVDTGTLLMDTQIKHYFDYGGEKVIFDTDELKKIKSFDDPGNIYLFHCCNNLYLYL